MLNFEVSAPDQRTAPVWTNRQRSLVGVVRVPDGRARTLQVCTIAAPKKYTASARTLAITGNPIRLPAAARIVDVQIAENWIVWATQLRAHGPVVVHRRAIAGRAPRTVSRTFASAVDGTAVTPRGTIVVNQVEKSINRVWAWRPGRSLQPLVPARKISNDADAPPSRQRFDLSTWEPGLVSLGLTGPAGDRIVTVDGRRGCTPWDSSRSITSGSTASDRSTNRLRVVVDTDLGWSRRVVSDDPWSSSPDALGFTEHLKICDRAGRRLYAATTGQNGYSTEDSQTVGTPDIVGGAVIFDYFYYQGSGGSGNTTTSTDAVLVPADPNAAPGPDVRFPVATTTAAAWATKDAIWASDATGVHRTALTTDGLRGLRLNGSRLIASKTVASQSIDLSPLPARSVALANSRTSDADFGQCSGQFAEACAIPPTDG
ncbi:hypothetical protein AB0L40_04300 [Patulibacter sp. NPDC049589]|uniref:hypothetical protein n=1 Tax=Patulibacter sp. NPDC049589 TaxID=3154731 RepID=UPI00342EB345